MFQVDPERVLYATGKSKLPARLFKPQSPRARRAKAPKEEAEPAAEEESAVQATEAEQDPDTTDAPEPAPVDMAPTRKQIQDLTAEIKAILRDVDVSVSQKRRMRFFIKNAKPLLTRAGRPNANPTEIANQLSTLVAELDLGANRDENAPAEPSSDPFASLTDAEMKRLEQRMEAHAREEAENPFDPSKPYVTPWRPRDYMAPFAFIPQYLEVNQNICSAVYLRHPVARRGTAEVPTPYPIGVNQLAFNWYLRRR